MEKRIGKRDLIFLAVVLAAILAVFGVFSALGKHPGSLVRVTVDGEVYGVYDLTADQPQTIDIAADGTVTNILLIEDGAADMIQADCPDKLCVKQRAISAEGETIVCLPNRVVAEVLGGEKQPEFDSMAK